MSHNKTIFHRFESIFIFPRPDLEDRVWHRFLKVVFVVGIVPLMVVAGTWSTQLLQPNYVYSFEQQYNEIGGKSKSLREIYIPNDDIAVSYSLSSDEAANRVAELGKPIAGRRVTDYYKAYRVLDDQGFWDDVRVKDESLNFNGGIYTVVLTIFLAVCMYLLLTHVVYRTIAYIVVGKEKRE